MKSLRVRGPKWMKFFPPNLESILSLNDEESRRHARELDLALGFTIQPIEEELLSRARLNKPEGHVGQWGEAFHEGHQTWVGLDYQTLQTPYKELIQMCRHLSPKKDSLLVDLGAGYGRLGFVLHELYPDVNFIGYEYVEERVREGARVLENLNCSRAQLLHQDLSDPGFKLPHADIYFLYDYGKVSHIRHTLEQLEDIASRETVKVIARGKGVRSLIQEDFPWMGQVHDPYHEKFYSIYTLGF